MIHDVDAGLRALIERDALNGTDVDVVFDAPTKEWASRRNAPTIDVYLYDIREDLRRREVGRIDVRGADGIVTERRQPPRWFKLSYLVTAWTQRPEDEHRLLSQLMVCFLQRDQLPPDLLGEVLRDIGLPVGLTLAIPPPEDRALSDTWSALGGDLKPSLDVVVLAPFDLARGLHFGPPVLEEPRFQFGDETKGGRRRGGTAPVEPETEPYEPASEEVRGGQVGDSKSGRIYRLKEMPRVRR